MGSAPSDAGSGADETLLTPFKILVAGGFGVGKTTLVGSISEIRPLRTEEVLTQVSIGVDDLSGVGKKSTTTVAMDFGRITMGKRLALYLFGTPGQDRFWFMWDDLAYGALGAVVMADTRRLTDCFPAVDYFERRGVPFVVAVNVFDGSPHYDPEDVRIALDLDPHVPTLLCDARERSSVKHVLITLVEHVLTAEASEGQQAVPGTGNVGQPSLPAGSVRRGIAGFCGLGEVGHDQARDEQEDDAQGKHDVQVMHHGAIPAAQGPH
jgi:signal recognition particle receptor subunit beta